jgi:uncharacterized protein Yka (UPF0111/DUF47 family)
VSDVAGASSNRLLAILAEHASVARDAMALAADVVEGPVGPRDAGQDMDDLEDRGDRLRRRLVAELAQTLVTPLDREDLFRLSRSVDDLVDNTRDFVREWALYNPESARNLVSILVVLRTGTDELAAAIKAVVDQPERAASHLLAAKHAAGSVRRRFEEEVAALFSAELSPEVLKHRELLRRLDVVGIRLGEASDVLFDGLVRRGEGLMPLPSVPE